MIESIGLAIQRAARFILRITLGLRVPVARVRVHDQKSRHDYALEQLSLAQTQVFLWEREAAAAYDAFLEARAALDAIERRRSMALDGVQVGQASD